MVEEVHIVDYLRSAFSRSRLEQPERDVFNKNRTGIDPMKSRIITGCTMQMGFTAGELSTCLQRYQ